MSSIGIPQNSPNTNSTGAIRPPKGSEPLPAETRAALDALVAEVGEEAAAERLRMNARTLVRIIAGRPVRRGTADSVTLYIRGAPAA